MSSAAPTQSFWRRRLIAPIATQLTQGVTPQKLALTLALGLTCGLFPFLGFTSLLCLLVGLSFRLNQPIIQVINQLLWPVQLPMIVVYLKIGAHLYGTVSMPFNPSEVTRIFWASQREFWSRFGLMGLHALTAWLLSVPILVGITYAATLPLMRKLASAKAVKTY